MTHAASEDYYVLLGVSEHVSTAELRRVWRHLAKRA
jgi:DnaJ-class molecular chaperone